MNKTQKQAFKRLISNNGDYYKVENENSDLFSLIWTNGTFVVCESIDGTQITGVLNLEAFNDAEEIKEGHYDDLSSIGLTDVFSFYNETQFGVEKANELFLFDLLEKTI